MPKASDVKNVKMAAEADSKKEEKITEVKAPAAKAVVAKPEEKKTEEKKPEEVKTTEAAAAKTEEKAPAVKKAAPAKKTTAAKKTAPAKKAAPAKAAAASKAVKEALYIQYAGKELDSADIMKRVQAAYKGNAKTLKEIKVYVKPEENAAYYVINGEETGSIML